MTHIVLFNLIQGLICLFAFTAGGRPERLTALMLLVAAALTYALPYRHLGSYYHVEWALLAIDIALLYGLSAVASRANRFWPIWIAALHLLAIAVHAVKGLTPDLVPWTYAMATGKIAYPMLAILAIGTLRHRDRCRVHAADPDWTKTPAR